MIMLPHLSTHLSIYHIDVCIPPVVATTSFLEAAEDPNVHVFPSAVFMVNTGTVGDVVSCLIYTKVFTSPSGL